MPIGNYYVKIAWTLTGDFSGTYDNVSQDVVAGIQRSDGFPGPYERAAKVGEARFELSNGRRNYNALWRLYSPDYGAGALAGYVQPHRYVEIGCTYSAVTRVLWSGYVLSIEPHPERDSVIVKCADGVYPLAAQKINLPIQVNQHSGELIRTIIDSVYIPREGSTYWHFDNSRSLLGISTILGDVTIGYEIDTGVAVLPFAGDTWRPESTTALAAIRDATLAEWGRFWVTRNGSVKFWKRDREYTDLTIDATLDGAMIQFVSERASSSIFNRITALV